MSLVVEKIQNGTVIDHIRGGQGLLVLKILGITSSYGGKVAFVMNAPSKKLGKKDIVKVADREIDTRLANKIALIAPEATFNIIRDGVVVEKKQVKLPDTLVGIAKCPDPACITNHEKEVISEFVKVGPQHLRCVYCEKTYRISEIELS